MLVSEPQLLLSLNWSLPLPTLSPLLCALGEAGGALGLAAQTILCMCSHIRLNLLMFPVNMTVMLYAFFPTVSGIGLFKNPIIMVKYRII